jgi:hypothetical protein
MFDHVVRKIFTSKYLSPDGGKKGLRRLVEKSGFLVQSCTDPEREAIVRLISKIYSEVRFGVDYIEAFQLYRFVEQLAKIPGDIAELGAYQGGSARLICEVKGAKALHLFDTFEGMPAVNSEDAKFFPEGSWKSDLESVKAYLAGFPGVHFHKGFFPETARPVENLRFSFVHLDADLYESTLTGLEFFFPRLNTGGVLVSHDS